MKNHNLFSLFLIFIFCVSSNIFSKEEKLEITPEEYEKIVQEHIKEIHHDCLLEGTVCDKEGSLLDGVEIRVIETRTYGFDKNKDIEHKTSVDKNFSIKASGVIGITLHFHKDGYYDEKLFFSTYEQLKKKDMKVTLKKIGKLANLTSYDAYLEFNPNGNAQIIDFSKSKGKANMEVLNISDLKSLPENCAYINADCDKTGKIETELINEDCYYPRKIRLIMNDSEGGFILFKPKEEKIYREMSTAPEKGYERELCFNINDMKIRDGVYGIYFYFKTKGKYGKGKVCHIEYREEEGVFRKGGDNLDKKGDGILSIRAEFRINPDGTRNLETKN